MDNINGVSAATAASAARQFARANQSLAVDCNTINELWELDARRMDYRRAADYHRRKSHQAAMRRNGLIRFAQGAAMMAALWAVVTMVWG